MKTAVRRVLLMSALMSPSALYALGLGEIKLNSALNQPFDAEIELVSAAQEDLGALRASLASNDTFVRYGLDRPGYLSEFTFRVVRSDGRDVLKVTSPRPVTEPFVTLLVEANWPRGRLLREYTVLLDPPVFAPAAVAPEPAVAVPRTAPAPRTAQPRTAPAPTSAPAPTPAAAPGEARAARPTAAVAAEPGSTYQVRPRDTLWEIASSAYPGTRSEVNRAMVAIYQSNPAAFGGNINVLRAGSELRMPSAGDVSAISASAAADEVARQYQAWKAGTAAAPASATDAGRLRLVTPEQGSAAASTATEAAPATAPTADLQDRVKQLEAELAEARRLLEVRNAELATLQGAAEPAVPAQGEVPAEGVAAEPAAGAEAPPAAAAEPTEPAAVTEPEPAPPAAEPARTPPAEPGVSLVDRLLEYWWLLLGLLVAGLGVAAFLRSRRASSTAEEDLEEALGRRADDLRARVAVAAPAKEAPIVVEERVPGRAAVAPAAAEPSRKPTTVEDTLSGEGPVSVESGDPLAEADFHMAYGLYDQAADLVQLASKREPQRRDLKLKLLEIFFVWGNRDRFLELAREMSASRASSPAGEWDKVLIMGRQLAPEDPLFAGPVRGAADSLDMELQGGDQTLDLKLPGLGEGTATNLDVDLREPRVEAAEGGLDFVLDEPVRGADVDESLAPTVETPRIRPATAAAGDDQTAEVPIEELGLDVGELEALGELTDLESELSGATTAATDDTVERPTVSAAGASEDDLLSSTSIMGNDTLMGVVGEPEPGVVDLSDLTGELPTVEKSTLEVTGYLKQPDFAVDAESATMSEVGTKLDLARAYIDMGDPEGARSILEEVLKEGSPGQRKQAEKLLGGLP
jgi:pilus assembly protein FimV